MTDIVERLRNLLTAAHLPERRATVEEAAAEIERLRAERDERTAEVARLLMEIEARRAKAMSRPWSPTEPARSPDYRRTYIEVRKLYDRISGQDGCITFLLVELRALQKRVTKLEQRNDDLAAAALRLAHNNMEEVRAQEQRPAEMTAP